MARMLPNLPLGALPPETLKVFQRLKRLPDSFCVWQRLPQDGQRGPDFLILDADRRALLLAVSTATPREARAGRQGDLFEPGAPLGAGEGQVLTDFIAQLPLPADLMGRAVCFPNLAEADLAAAEPALPAEVHRAGTAELAPEGVADWVASALGPPLPDAAAEQLRRAFSPEVVVPPQLTVRARRDRGTDAQLSRYSLSYDQEWALKHDLALSDEARAAADNVGVQLISGAAGSGKSLILLYRARLLRRFFPRKRLLVLTHNRPLIRDLEARYRRLDEDSTAIEWRTFHGWCRAHWPEGEPYREPLGAQRRLALVDRVRREHLAGSTISTQQLADEIDWVKDQLITSREGYLAADRAGRGFALSAAMRERVFAAVVAYQQTLGAQGLYDYGDVPRGLWRALDTGRARLTPYDVVLIDEAQFFAPIWFEILKRALAPGGQFFLVADPTQGFLKRRHSWQASGLEVRGRTQRLARSYRSTRAILDFATQLYRLRLPDDGDALIAQNARSATAGIPPELIALSSEQDETTRVVNEIAALRTRGVPLAHILVLHSAWDGVERVLGRLRQAFGADAAVNPREVSPGAQIRVCTINAATGLESPIVFLMGAHRLWEAEGSIWLGEEERAELIRDNTRKLYMAITRAGQRLVMTYVGSVPEALRHLGAALT
jgi:superfamily I DNA/RNA helicase